ncbi:GNAT family N-acetyltransferase [Metabacillus litoralis]|uniref:GNAT family N-acetyltransferase n=1 Tax=Metabacillus litoralis TaxID=152268 RepID=A0A5C6W5Y1_9BACI|nr:GNAT family N-acetyltransferase [Metabacillus litoralis]TXC92814.1 GNAT family N-acetyltransferase [Metabacillus litoralis]
MNSPELVIGYQNDDKLRFSFNELATSIFGIQFEDWYQMGYWDHRYVPHSYVVDNNVVANVSVNLIDVIVEGIEVKAIQLGTVMTHPDFRNKGLSAKLMNEVLSRYEGQYDFMYLFANNTVLDFYPKFGFGRCYESIFTTTIRSGNTNYSITKLDGTLKQDREFVHTYAKQKKNLSTRFATFNADSLLMFYCINVFTNDLYYIKELDAIIVAKFEEEQLHLFDCLSKEECSLNEVGGALLRKEEGTIIFHFTPELNEADYQIDAYEGDDVLFVLSKMEKSLPLQFKHPLTSKA